MTTFILLLQEAVQMTHVQSTMLCSWKSKQTQSFLCKDVVHSRFRFWRNLHCTIILLAYVVILLS